MELKNSQDSELFQLEQEYLALVRDRRTNLINYLRTNSTGNSSARGKRDILEGLKACHNKTQLELEEFLKVKVYQEWQLGQLRKQIDALREAGFPAALLYNDPHGQGMKGAVAYYQSVMKYLLNAAL